MIAMVSSAERRPKTRLYWEAVGSRGDGGLSSYSLLSSWTLDDFSLRSGGNFVDAGPLESSIAMWLCFPLLLGLFNSPSDCNPIRATSCVLQDRDS
jgi:hypothetical protein